MRAHRGVLVAGSLFWMAQSGWGQVYSDWFLNQKQIGCPETVVGYAEYSASHPDFTHRDSSAVRAAENAYEVFSCEQRISIVGGRAYWKTGRGMVSMGDSVLLRCDSAAVAEARKSLVLLDTLFAGNMVAVLLGRPECKGSISDSRSDIQSLSRPGWVRETPHKAGFLYAVGVAPRYFYEAHSWQQAEKNARKTLAEVLGVRVSTLQRAGRALQEVIHEEFETELTDTRTMARWWDREDGLCYVLVRGMLKGEGE